MRLLDTDHAGPCYVTQLLHPARWPYDLDQVRRCRRAQPEMHGSGAGRGIAAGGCNMIVLRAGAGNDFDPRADGIAVALGALEPELEPMTRARALIHPDLGRSADRADHHVQPPVAVQVADR